jgi:hypothetical protein
MPVFEFIGKERILPDLEQLIQLWGAVEIHEVVVIMVSEAAHEVK